MKTLFKAGTLFAICSAMLILAGCHRPAIYTEKAKLAEFTEQGVTVVVALESDSEGKSLLRAIFTPEPGFHLYDKNLPGKGIKGFGRPTQLELAPHPDIKSTGAVFTEAVAHEVEFKALAVSLPVYPDGPVTLRLPIQLATGTGEVSAKATLGYMACSQETCKIPVTKTVELKIPRN